MTTSRLGGEISARDEVESLANAGEASAPCAVCGAQTALWCSGCEAVLYCSEECQERDWRHHRRVCNRLAQQQPNSHGDTPVGGCGAATSPFRDHAINPSGAVVPVETAPARSQPLLPSPSPSPSQMVRSFQQGGASPTSPAAREAVMSARERRLQLRASAVLAAREGRHSEALEFAAEAYDAGQNLARSAAAAAGGAGDTLPGQPEAEAAALAETLIICRAACVEGDNAMGCSFLQTVLQATDRLAGTGNTSAILEPSVAAMLLCSVAELCYLYEQRENAEGYAHAFLDMARRAHGEGSPMVGDAHTLILGMLVKWGRHEEAVSHAKVLLEIRQRQSQNGSSDRALSDAYWNLALLTFQVDQSNPSTLENLRAARDLHSRHGGESVTTAEIDVALGTAHRARADYRTAVRLYRTAMRARQRFLGFAHPETRRLASLLDATEVQMRSEIDAGYNFDVLVTPKGGLGGGREIARRVQAR